MLSLVIPAYNEERYLPPTLSHLHQAREFLSRGGGPPVEVIVVDNGSVDQTARVAAALGATMLTERIRSIAAARNAGARAAAGDALVFLDADTIVPERLLARIDEALADPACLGGAVESHYAPWRLALRAYLQVWRVLGLLGRLAQGATQFCRRDVRVEPSCRRFDQWPSWRTLLWTNPAVILLFRRRRRFWSGWNEGAPR